MASPVIYITVLTIAVAFAVALATGGRPRHLADHMFRLGALPIVGVALDLASEMDALRDVWFPIALLSYACLVAFVVANIHLTGMFLVLIGIGLNLLTIVVNVGMPVRAEAVVESGYADDLAEARADDYGAKHHLERPDDTLMPISDIIPVPPIKRVVSIGDLIMALGIGVVIFHLLRPPPTRLRGVRRSTSDRPDPPPRAATPRG